MIHWAKYPKEFGTVARVELTNTDVPVLYALTAEYRRSYTTRWFASTPVGDVQEWGITCPTVDMWKQHDIYSGKELLDPINAHRPQMRVIAGTPTRGELPNVEFTEPAEQRIVFETDGIRSEVIGDAQASVSAALQEAGSTLHCELDGDTLVVIGPAEEGKEGLGILRRVLKRTVPKAEHTCIELTRIGPDDTRKTFGLNPSKK